MKGKKTALVVVKHEESGQRWHTVASHRAPLSLSGLALCIELLPLPRFRHQRPLLGDHALPTAVLRDQARQPALAEGHRHGHDEEEARVASAAPKRVDAAPCQQRYRWCLEKNATQTAAISLPS